MCVTSEVRSGLEDFLDGDVGCHNGCGPIDVNAKIWAELRSPGGCHPAQCSGAGLRCPTYVRPSPFPCRMQPAWDHELSKKCLVVVLAASHRPVPEGRCRCGRGVALCCFTCMLPICLLQGTRPFRARRAFRLF